MWDGMLSGSIPTLNVSEQVSDGFITRWWSPAGATARDKSLQLGRGSVASKAVAAADPRRRQAGAACRSPDGMREGAEVA